MGQFDDILLESPDGQELWALINGDRGWLLYLRGRFDSGLTSRNPDYDGPSDATILYQLRDGQHEEYPASWALPTEVVRQAMAYFELKHQRPPFVVWHED